MEKRTSIKTLRTEALSILPVMPNLFFKSNELAQDLVEFDVDLDAPKDEIRNENKENVDERQDFSFSCTQPQGTLVFADEIFDNGKIQPIYHAFNHSLIYTTAHDNDNDNNTLPSQPPLKKVFVKQVNDFSLQSKGRYIENDTLQNTMMVEMKGSNAKHKKSNSTGFSKIWKFRQNLKLRSNSDGKNTFVFLNPSVPMKSNHEKEEKILLRKEKDEKCRVAMSAHEKLYVMNRTRKDQNKRTSFLPYRKDLIGFFTNADGLSRNLHPF